MSEILMEVYGKKVVGDGSAGKNDAIKETIK